MPSRSQVMPFAHCYLELRRAWELRAAAVVRYPVALASVCRSLPAVVPLRVSRVDREAFLEALLFTRLSSRRVLWLVGDRLGDVQSVGSTPRARFGGERWCRQASRGARESARASDGETERAERA